MSRKPYVDGRETTMRVIKDDLLRWTCERHATDCPLDRHLLRDKALELTGEYGLTGRIKPDTTLRRATVLMCCNAFGTEKLPLLICGSYPAVITNEDYVYAYNMDASINVDLFKEWLRRLNDRILRNDRKVLLLLHRDRISAFRELELSNVGYVFFPNDFPPFLRPLKRDVFHFVKMIYRSK